MRRNRPVKHSELDFIIRIAGEGGDGVVSCGELLAQMAARTEFHVFTFITYPAEMRGGYSMIQIRLRDITIYSMGSMVDCLVVFNQQAFDNSIEVLKPGGVLLYDPAVVDIGKHDHEYMLEPIPLTMMAKEATGGSLSKNMVALGALSYLFGADMEMLETLMNERYASKGEEAMAKNHLALDAGYHAAANINLDTNFRLADLKPAGENYMLISGNQAVALGAIAAGCRFTAGYPITPSTSIFETLTRLLPLVGGRAIQMEDEIAAISAIIGASFAGEKVITPTSGPGLQLMTEQLSLASMIEVPIVIVDVQRAGPSTGLPTKTEQSDLKYAVYGAAGESPRITLAPTGVEDSFYQTIRAFNLAERYQVPVLLLLDQSIGYRKATVKMPDFDKLSLVDKSEPRKSVSIPKSSLISIVNRIEPSTTELEDYMRYLDTDDGTSPIARPGTLGGQYLATGLEHDERGIADQSPKNHLKMSKKRFRKLEFITKQFEKNPIEFYGPPDAVIGLIGWGSTEGAIREARYHAEKEGVVTRHLHPHTISPLPSRQISLFLLRLKYLLIVEENLTGQFAHYIKAKFGVKSIGVRKCEGMPITSDEILKVIMKVAGIDDEDNCTSL
ncbi:MAG TPA: 2-oxoacid:acceptor oxidoreductase subunit alpha [Spirochaeta sp.]|nr:2-oxoacid:acceptor oxidoreductase subunit alpha [Spirochaeta sp.]